MPVWFYDDFFSSFCFEFIRQRPDKFQLDELVSDFFTYTNTQHFQAAVLSKNRAENLS